MNNVAVYLKRFADTGVGKAMVEGAVKSLWIKLRLNDSEHYTDAVLVATSEHSRLQPLLVEAALNYVQNRASGRWVQTIQYPQFEDIGEQLNAGTLLHGIKERALMTAQDQLAEFIAANDGYAFPQNIEGYWRYRLIVPTNPKEFVSKQDKELPFPVVYEPEGYDKHLFITLLREMQESPFTTSHAYRGISISRLTGEENGNREFERDGWRWPQGYLHYIEAGVPPSRAFYRFVTTIDLPCLPTYGRD